MGADTNAFVSPTTWPTATGSPGFTVGSQGAPMCCCMAMITRSGGGMTTDSLSAVFFRWGTDAPPCGRDVPKEKNRLRVLFSIVFPLSSILSGIISFPLYHKDNQTLPFSPKPGEGRQ